MDETQLERKLLEQLRDIFPLALRSAEWRSTPQIPVSRADLVAETRSGRLLLFEVKNLESRSRPPSSWYLQLASYRDHLVDVAGASPPILALAINMEIDQQTRHTFGRAGIPVFQIGDSSIETRARMQDAFNEVAIELPELRSPTGALRPVVREGSHVASRRARTLRCFLSFPTGHGFQYGEVREAINSALHAINAEVLSSREAIFRHQTVLRERSKMIRSSDVLVADISDQDPMVMVEVGMAFAFGVPLVLLIRENASTVDFVGERVLRFSESLKGLELLRDRLIEVLAELAARSGPRSI
jgi:hypothetical protein